MTNDTIPFGKYRGQEIEQIRQRDPAYLQWLVQQAWFSERFAPTYQLIVNNFSPPSDETPAHNALQVRFLDYDFQVAFWEASKSDADVKPIWKNLIEQVDGAIKRLGLRKAPVPFQYNRRDPTGWHKDRMREHRAEVLKKWKTWRVRKQQPQPRLQFGQATFENISDVSFPLNFCLKFHQPFPDFRIEDRIIVHIEIKPSMGDDYPAVLRQVKRQQAQITPAGVNLWFLLVDQFASQAVTLEQVCKIFERDEIRVVMVQDVRECLIRITAQSGDTPNPPT